MAFCHMITAMSEDRKPQTADKYILRFPDGMRDRIAEAAKSNNRSMNAEIVGRLLSSFEVTKEKPPIAYLGAIAALKYQLAAARLQLHQKEVERQRLIDPVREAVKLLTERELEEEIYDFRALELLSQESEYSRNALLKKTQELEYELARAEKDMQEHVSDIMDDQKS